MCSSYAAAPPASPGLRRFFGFSLQLPFVLLLALKAKAQNISFDRRKSRQRQ
jgi:hypothetical protein